MHQLYFFILSPVFTHNVTEWDLSWWTKCQEVASFLVKKNEAKMNQDRKETHLLGLSWEGL